MKIKTKSKTIRDLSLTIVGSLIFVNTFSSTATAQEVLMLQGGHNKRCSMIAIYDWNGATGGVVIPPPDPAPPNPWSGAIATIGPTISVGAALQHDPGLPVCDDAHGRNGTPLVLGIGAVPLVPPPPLLGVATRLVADAGQVRHGLEHFDIGFLDSEVSINAAGVITNRKIQVAIVHEGSIDRLVKNSYTNTTSSDRMITIVPDYRMDNGDMTYSIKEDPSQQIKRTVQPGQRIEIGPFDKELGDGSILASWKILAESSAKTETNLAFLGTVDGFFTELDFGPAVSLFAGNREFFVPDLRPANGDDTLELFVGVDLTQWLASEFTFDVGDIFSLTDGTSDEIPGILVGTSPITLGPSGFQTDNPYNLPVVAIAPFDGQLVPVPEPTSTLSLLSLGILGAGTTLKRKIKRSNSIEKETTKIG